MKEGMKKSGRWTIPVLWMFVAGALVHAQAPPPKEILGFEVGADYHLASYEQAVEYLKVLDEASPRLTLFEMGKTSMGKPMMYAAISSEENLEKLDHYKDVAKGLTLAKGLTDERARQMAAEGKAIVYIDGGLHATEVAPAQQNLQLAYDLVTGEDARTRLIRDNVILILVFPNPDGMDMVAEWYTQNMGTPYEVSPMPWLYHKYVGHDNNRDSFMINMVETQNLARLQNREWYPVIIYNQHQTAPFPARIFIPPNAEPANPNEHPLILRGKNLVGSAMGFAFDREGKEGAVSRVAFDLWYPGYVDQVGDFFNTISILTETALYRYATPKNYTLEDIPEAYRDFTIGSFYPSPWKGGWWRLRDAVDYCETASKAVLHTAAVYRTELLYNKYLMGKGNIDRFSKEPPYAWIFPLRQWDAPTAALLLNKMIGLGIEVYEADEGFVSDGITYPEGTWVIPMNQAYALFVKAVLEEQSFPDLTEYPALWQGIVRPQKFPGAYLPPYDNVGWTLPEQMGVKAIAAQTPLQVGLRPLKEVEAPAGAVEGQAGYAYLLSPKTNNSFKAVNRLLAKGVQVLRAREPIEAGESYPPGAWVIPSGGVARSTIESLAEELALPVGTTGRSVSNTYAVKAPRVALYQSWVANADEGWTRWLFEQFEIPFTTVHDADIKAGNLGGRFDVLVIPSQSSEAIVEGNEEGSMPPMYVGGITPTGVENIGKFVRDGGTLVTLNDACIFAAEWLGLPVSDLLKDLKPAGRRETPRAQPPEFICPGSLLRMNFDASHPVAYGMPEEAAGFFDDSPAFAVHPTFDERRPRVIAKYAGDHLLMSGYLKGEPYLVNQAAAVEVPLGRGRVILLGFGVQSRAQPHGTFKLLFNALYYGLLPSR